MIGKVNKVVPVPCNTRNFYKLWLSFLVPLHKFTPHVVAIAGELLRHRQELSKKILDEKLLSKILLGQEVREEIMKDCDCTLSTFRVTINKLKKAGFFKDGSINPLFIPAIEEGSNGFNLMLAFKITNES